MRKLLRFTATQLIDPAVSSERFEFNYCNLAAVSVSYWLPMGLNLSWVQGNDLTCGGIGGANELP